LSIKKEAAFHEAGHAIMAYLSAYHGLISGIDLKAYGAGDVYISLLKSKCAAAGLPQTPESAKRPEVAKDIGRILVAGLVAEKIAAERDKSLVPNPDCAIPDHELLRQQLETAGLSKKFDLLESETCAVLKENWAVVEELADFLFANVTANKDQVEAIIGLRMVIVPV
tara:strand:- start:22553 stop:23056 length:504 start_codon:yes stop_codon:yes gene_type:complete